MKHRGPVRKIHWKAWVESFEGYDRLFPIHIPKLIPANDTDHRWW